MENVEVLAQITPIAGSRSRLSYPTMTNDLIDRNFLSSTSWILVLKSKLYLILNQPVKLPKLMLQHSPLGSLLAGCIFGT